MILHTESIKRNTGGIKIPYIWIDYPKCQKWIYHSFTQSHWYVAICMTTCAVELFCICAKFSTQIAKFMGTTWGPPGSCRPQMAPHVKRMNLTIRKGFTLPIRQRASWALPCSQRSVNPSSINWIIVHLVVLVCLWRSSTGHSFTTCTHKVWYGDRLSRFYDGV